MTSSTEVIVSSPTYLRNMSRIIQSTHPRILNNYLIWHVTQQNVPGLSLHFRYAAEKMSNIVENTRTTKEAWRECVGVVDGKFGMELGAVFVKRKFPAESKKRVEDMIEDIKLSFHHIFDTLEWMDELTKDKAREKLNATFDMIGYPDYILDTEYMDKYYEKMTIVKDDFFQNIQSSLNFEYENAKKKLNSPVEKYNWDMTPPEINAYYGNNNNAIVFPAGLLQWPFYDPTFPRYVNFAGVGTVIGHELTHAFDNWGAQFDKDGNINNWWTDESWDKFERRSQCLVDLYSQYVMEGTRVNGLLTMGENMADIGGLTQSYFAYKQMESREGTELPLAGLNLTQEQTFFLAYSQTWCIVRRPHSLKNHILTDEHAPEKLRVLVPLMHMTEFAEAYQCPLGSPMNPVDRCDDDRRLWW
uniref:Endothelin-converting enzyme-like 1-like n=1 Tax=Saccoglossus kowalevskii TaxID=10224 RepID=A0ABM0LXV3_SACKO|nr:PREDICTED: endothelin-converting enzyme-like 1-like [Saccoglossus kowalevskii]